jgi:hypothetical protein
VPEAVTENVAVWPTSTDWLKGWLVIAGATAMPVPLMDIASGELNCGLTMEKLPETSPAVVGSKLAVNVKLLPGDRVRGRDAPPTVKPAPVTVTWEMVSATLPEFVTLKL